MDLTKTYPRSVHERVAGVVQLGRTIDKARASVAGTIGEYHYNCPMDQAVFRFLGIDDPEAFARLATQTTDAALEEQIERRYVSKKSPAEIERWNQEWLEHRPDPGSDSERYFLDVRGRIAPGRPDVRTWADLLDLEEGRSVPRRSAA
jgi:hypothetical protein